MSALDPYLIGLQYNFTSSTPALLKGYLGHSLAEQGKRYKRPVRQTSYLGPVTGCGGQVRELMCQNCGSTITVPTTCGDRTCPDCRLESGRKLRRRYLPLVSQCAQDELALLTLTLRIEAGPEDLAAKLGRIRDAWSKLLRLAVWRPVRGGLAAIEVLPAGFGAWNVHIHAILEAGLVVRPFSYYDKHGQKRQAADVMGSGAVLRPQDVSEAWHRLTGDSYIADIQPVRTLPDGRGGARGALRYILKYLFKGQEWAGGPERRQAYNEVMHGRRLVMTFGQWHPTHRKCRWPVLRRRPVRPCKVCGEAAGWLSVWGLWALSARALPVAPRPPPDPFRAPKVDKRRQTLQDVFAGCLFPA